MKTVLIVDDEPLFLASLTEGLAAYAAEFTGVTARNERIATEVLDSRPVDLVVTDLKMPDMDGFQLLAYMIYRHLLVPAIVMTAFGTPAIEERLRTFDTIGYLHLIDGGIVDALCGETEGEAAAHQIVCWADAEIEMVNLFKKTSRRIQASLPNLLMDAAQMKDEKARERDGESESPSDVAIELGVLGENASTIDTSDTASILQP